jgi:transcriptional regulator with XRE-family HTH domain
MLDKSKILLYYRFIGRKGGLSMNLKSFREDKLKLSQTQFAELLAVEQSQVSRWESNPDTIRYDMIQKILEKTGATYEELTGWQKPIPKPLEVDNSWMKADFTKRSLSDYIPNALKNVDIPEEQRKAYVDDLRNGISSSIVKPQVTIVGRSDTGKSTLINALLGAEKMPTAWTPTTTIAVYIKHISDKPSFIEEDVWVFSNRVGNEDLWDEKRMHDEEYCRSWKSVLVVWKFFVPMVLAKGKTMEKTQERQLYSLTHRF